MVAAAQGQIRICTKCRASYRDPHLGACPRDGGPLTPWEEDPLLGEVLGGCYQIVEPLGQGGMGSVYLAERLPDELEVAIKIVRQEHRHNPTVHERFIREVRHTTSIHSPNVVRIFDTGMSPDGRAFMVMELLTGETLTERLRRPPALAPYDALHVAREIARALSAAHAAGVIHRDLKPDNIFLCSDGAVKVVDFGIAKAFAHEAKRMVDEPSLTEAHRVVGTPVYMAPEVITKAGLYPSSDLYALGVILYEMMVGEPPFYEKDAIGTMYRHLHEQPQRLREVDERLNIPGGLETLVRDLLEKRPEDRPADASEVGRRLHALMQIVRDNERRLEPQTSGELTRVWSPKERESKPSGQVALGGAPKKTGLPARKRALLLAGAAALALVLGFAATAALIYVLNPPTPQTVLPPSR
ncbi:MAG: serine/threonine protein kinase [Sandaracinaceae bacterium]|nr:serine/threonine protein kinase [Sandaracinaceae bacterium]